MPNFLRYVIGGLVGAVLVGLLFTFSGGSSIASVALRDHENNQISIQRCIALGGVPQYSTAWQGGEAPFSQCQFPYGR